MNLSISTNTKWLWTINYRDKIITACSNDDLKKYGILPNRRHHGTKSNSWKPFGRNNINSTTPNHSCSCFVLTMLLLCRLIIIQRISETRSLIFCIWWTCPHVVKGSPHFPTHTSFIVLWCHSKDWIVCVVSEDGLDCEHYWLMSRKHPICVDCEGFFLSM